MNVVALEIDAAANQRRRLWAILSVSPKFEYFLSDGNSWAKLKVGFVSVQWQQKNRFRAGGGVAKKTLLS